MRILVGSPASHVTDAGGRVPGSGHDFIEGLLNPDGIVLGGQEAGLKAAATQTGAGKMPYGCAQGKPRKRPSAAADRAPNRNTAERQKQIPGLISRSRLAVDPGALP
jgi:hypothetical protein